MQIKELCQRHAEYDELIFSKEFVSLKAANLIPVIEEKISQKYMSHKNDGNSYILYWLGLTTKRPEKEFTLVSHKSARVSIPDCDLDFEDDRREEMTRYIVEKYGEDRVCQVVTFGHMKARASVRDVGRALAIPLEKVDSIAKSITNTPGKPINLRNSIDSSSEYYSDAFHKLITSDADAKRIYQYALPLENTIRQTGIHAAAVLIGDVPLVERIPLMVNKKAKTKFISQLDYPTAESIGMLKVDLLGLITLRIIRESLNLINEKYSTSWTIDNIPYESQEAFDLLGDGNTVGVFQVENSGLTRYLTQMKPKTFGQVADMISLYRPGPIGYIPQYINRLHGLENIESKHPVMEEITADTQGIMIYQEQVNQVLMRLGGYNAGDADKVRKAISKKNVADIEKNRKVFVAGCIKNNITEEVAESIYDDIGEFALYGFNHCISGKEIIRRDKNQHKSYTIEEMFAIKNSLEYAKSINAVSLHYKFRQNGYGMAFSMNKDNKIVKNRIKDIRYVGVRNTYRLQLESGKTISVTENHKFPTENGILRTDELKIGDKLYVADRHVKTKQSYNLYSETQPVNSEKGKEGFQERPNGNSRIVENIIAYHRANNNVCEICNQVASRYELHHKDFNKTNNTIENLQWLCVSCHKKEHYKNGRTKRYENGLSTKTEAIVSIESLVCENVYDVEMEAPNHNFVLDNGIVTCNSHAAAYARITLITAWIKANYPIEFLTACLICEGDDNSKRTKYVQDAKRNGIEVLPPQIGGTSKFAIDDNKIVFGLNSIDGIGGAMAESLSKTTLDEVFELNLKRNQLEKLIQSGCFDELGERQILLSNIDSLASHAKRIRRWSKIGQKLMYYPDLKITGEKTSIYKTAMLEYQALGTWIQFHPLQIISQPIKDCITRIDELDGEGIIICVVTQLEELTTKNGGKRLYKFVGVDEYGSCEILLNSKLSKQKLENGYIVHLHVSKEDEETTAFCHKMEILYNDDQ